MTDKIDAFNYLKKNTSNIKHDGKNITVNGIKLNSNDVLPNGGNYNQFEIREMGNNLYCDCYIGSKINISSKKSFQIPRDVVTTLAQLKRDEISLEVAQNTTISATSSSTAEKLAGINTGAMAGSAAGVNVTNSHNNDATLPLLKPPGFETLRKATENAEAQRRTSEGVKQNNANNVIENSNSNSSSNPTRTRSAGPSPALHHDPGENPKRAKRMSLGPPPLTTNNEELLKMTKQSLSNMKNDAKNNNKRMSSKKENSKLKHK